MKKIILVAFRILTSNDISPQNPYSITPHITYTGKTNLIVIIESPGSLKENFDTGLMNR